MVTERKRKKRPTVITRVKPKLPPPPKDVYQLAREQGIDLSKPAPDYVALATAVWPTKKDYEEAVKLLAEIRNKKSL